MSELAAFQDAFADALTTAQPIGRIAREPGFAVYRNTWLHGTVEALRATYPTVHELLGDEMFTAVAVEFCRRYPPRDPVLTRYGAGFAPFLRRQSWHDDLPYVADVARLDRLRLECFCADDDRTSMSPRAWELVEAGRGRRPRLDPATRFVWLDTPAVSIWLAHRDDDRFESLEPDWVAEGALFVRRSGSVSAYAIDRPTHRMLLAIAADTSVADIAALAAADGADPADILPPLVARGAIHLR